MSRLTMEERIQRRISRIMGHYGNGLVATPNILKIDPKWAEMIYKGEKTWEFRKRALGLKGGFHYLFETDPVNAITGYVSFSRLVATPAGVLLKDCRKVAGAFFHRPGRGADRFLREYAKDDEIVYAHFIHSRCIFPRPYRDREDDDRGVFLDMSGAHPILSFASRECVNQFFFKDAFPGENSMFFFDGPDKVEETLAKAKESAK